MGGGAKTFRGNLCEKTGNLCEKNKYPSHLPRSCSPPLIAITLWVAYTQ